MHIINSADLKLKFSILEMLRNGTTFEDLCLFTTKSLYLPNATKENILRITKEAYEEYIISPQVTYPSTPQSFTAQTSATYTYTIAGEDTTTYKFI